MSSCRVPDCPTIPTAGNTCLPHARELAERRQELADALRDREAAACRQGRRRGHVHV